MNKKNLPTSVRILLGVISALLCLALMVSSIAAIAIANIRIITSKDNLQTIISQTLFSTSSPSRITPRLAAGAALSTPTAQARDNPLRDTVVDALYNLIVGSSGSSLGVSRSQIEELLERSTVSDFLSEKIASVISDIYTGEDTTTLTRDDVAALLKENAGVIEEIFHIRVDQNKVDEVANYVDRYDVMAIVKAEVNKAIGAPVLPTTPTTPTTVPPQTTPAQTTPEPTEGPTGSTSGPTTATDAPPVPSTPGATVPDSGNTPVNPILSVLNTLRTYTSVNALLVALVICIVLAALLFLTNWGRPLIAAKWIAFSLLAASLPFLLVTVVASASPNLLAGLPGWVGIVGKIAAIALQLTLPVNLSVFVFAIGLLTATIVIRKLAEKKEANI